MVMHGTDDDGDGCGDHEVKRNEAREINETGRGSVRCRNQWVYDAGLQYRTSKQCHGKVWCFKTVCSATFGLVGYYAIPCFVNVYLAPPSSRQASVVV
jgi:hypothetical protein